MGPVNTELLQLLQFTQTLLLLASFMTSLKKKIIPSCLKIFQLLKFIAEVEASQTFQNSISAKLF